MLTQYVSEIHEWRRTWRTKSKFLSIKGCTTPEAAVKLAVKNAHAPSVRKALAANGLSTRAPRAAVAEYLEQEILDHLNSVFTFAEYDNWASTVIENIYDIYHNRYLLSDYTYGNAQKLFNMAVKYVFSADNISPTLPIFAVAHIPVDRVIMRAAKERLNVAPLPKAWSKTERLEDIMDYQKRLRDALQGRIPPLVWECRNW